MRTLLFVSLLFLSFTQGAFAQSLKPTEKQPAWVIINDSIVGELVLDTVQRRSLMNIERHYQRDFDLLHENDTMSDEVLRQRLHALTAKRQVEIKEVMAPAQFEQWLRMTEPHLRDHHK